MHTIRLRGPWTSQPLEGDRPLTRHTRRFTRPTNLAAGQRVWLVIDQTPGLMRVTLNGALLGQDSRLSFLPCPARFEIAPLLHPRNEIALDLSGGGPLGEVRLEIE